jgi:two-component system sensor histidine kinase KdpD
LRTSLLTSISHDLKTPLASILGAGSTLRDYDKELSDVGKAELLSTVINESERLNRFIANLLDMTKLESGAIVPNLALYDMGELVGAVLQRADKILADHEILVRLAGGLPMLRLDAVLFEQVLFNLLDNAAKYAADHTVISIQTWLDGDWAVLQVLDEGEGIPPEDIDKIFEKFYRARKGDRVLAGTGLGLAIAQGFVESMGGTISAGNRQDRSGAVFTLRLPVPADETTLDTAA